MIRLLQIQGADSGRELELDRDLIRIGRMPDSDVNFDPEVDLDASGRHAEIRNEDGRYLLIDTGSRNGTWLNGQRIKHAALEEGDEIEFGRGGPKLKVQRVESHLTRRVAADSDPARGSRREPRFDPMAVPVTTATRLEDLIAAQDTVATGPSAAQAAARRRHRRLSSMLLWGVAGVMLLAAIALVVRASLQ